MWIFEGGHCGTPNFRAIFMATLIQALPNKLTYHYLNVTKQWKPEIPPTREQLSLLSWNPQQIMFLGCQSFFHRKSKKIKPRWTFCDLSFTQEKKLWALPDFFPSVCDPAITLHPTSSAFHWNLTRHGITVLLVVCGLWCSLGQTISALFCSPAKPTIWELRSIRLNSYQ